MSLDLLQRFKDINQGIFLPGHIFLRNGGSLATKSFQVHAIQAFAELDDSIDKIIL